jgi:hypothetical protein
VSSTPYRIRRGSTRSATPSDSIRKHADGISEEIRKAQKALDVLVRKARSTLKALNIELHHESEERMSPIGLPGSSLADAVAALPGDGRAA